VAIGYRRAKAGTARRTCVCFTNNTVTNIHPCSKAYDIGEIPDSFESLEAFVRDHGPGRFDVDEHPLDLFP
jgi:hypothetical protein